jgi:hypothetical protein
MLTVREDRGSIAASVQHKIFSETLTQQKHETTNTVQLSLPGLATQVKLPCSTTFRPPLSTGKPVCALLIQFDMRIWIEHVLLQPSIRHIN